MKNNYSVTVLTTLVLCFLLLSPAAQARQQVELMKNFPSVVWPGHHGIEAHIARLDASGPEQGADELGLELPDGTFIKISRDGYKNRGRGNAVWRGRIVGNNDSRAVFTIRKGRIFGRIRIGMDVFEVRPYGPQTGDKQFVVERLDLGTFPDSDDAIPAADFAVAQQFDALSDQLSPSLAAAVAADGPVVIDVMSLYTADARNAVGGTANIEALIQAAVDAANAAFIDSNMTVQFQLVHTAQVAYSDSGNISSDLSWLVNNAQVAALRDQYGADMVSLIIDNGGAFCGVGYVQRPLGTWFAPYPFQVTVWDCAVGNLSFAHEHGHNMGMEHDPENGASPDVASFPWSFGHYINGTYRTVMSYSSPCSIYCQRVGRFSNPDVSYLGIATGIVDQRDNAYTGDLAAPVVAAFRPTAGAPANNPPVFDQDPIIADGVEAEQSATGTLAGTASDIDGDTLAFSKITGPAWLIIAANGDLSGIPAVSEEGLNSFTVQVSDGNGGTDSAQLNIDVTVPVIVPTDTVPPVITVLGDNPVSVAVGDDYTDAGATAADDVDDNITASIVTGGLPISTSVPGSHVVTYDVTDAAGNAAHAERTVEVVSSGTPVWVELAYDDFESGWGNYTDGGADASLYSGGSWAHQGTRAANIQDNSGIASSFWLTNAIDVAVPGYTQIKIEFWFMAVSFDNRREDFWVQFFDGTAWQTVDSYTFRTDFTNNRFYSVSLIIDELDYNFPADMRIRFTSDASSNNDDVYIDEIRISAQ